MHGGEDVVVALVIAGGNGAEVFEFAEEALDLIALPIEDWIEGREAFSGRHEVDVGHSTAFGEAVAQPVAVTGAIGQQGLTGPGAVIHVRAGSPVMRLSFGRLSFGQFQADRTATRINQRMDFRGQPAARATHGPKENKTVRGTVLPEDGSPPFFGPPLGESALSPAGQWLAAC